MNLKFWKKKVEVAEEIVPEKKLSSVIEITFKNGSKLGLRIPVNKGCRVKPWIDFWKWYFIKDSPRYGFEYDKGYYLFERKNIEFVHIFNKMI